MLFRSRIEYVDREYVQLADGRVVFADALTPEDEALVRPEAQRRAVKEPRVWWSVINGIEELTPAQEWNGRFIPIIPVLGRELQPFDGERRFVGMIRPAKDGQRLFNYAASNAVEIAALEPRAPFLMAEGQNEGYERMWEQANTRNFPSLIYKPTTIAGQPAPPPQRVPVDASRMSTSMALMQQADAFIQTTTAVFDPALGRINQSIDAARDMITTAISVNLSLITLQENEVTKRLAGYAALVAVPTLIAGIYGMNFEHMPELKWEWGYPVVLGAMGLVAAGMLIGFRRRKWL